MKPKTKIVTIDSSRYEIRKLPPDVGSYILMQIIGAGISASSTGGSPVETPTQAQTEKLSGEDMVRAMTFAAFLRGLDYDKYCFVQSKCIAACSRMEDRGGTELPMPIVNDSGQWAIPEIKDNLSLVVQLTVETLVFNLSDFFAEGGLASLAGSRPSTR